jgi:predicted nucleotidyltransferase
MQDARLEAILAEQRYPLLFATLSGSHLYGYASPTSDYDLRGVHILPVREVIGLHEGKETVDFIRKYADLEVDLVTHDVRKFFKLLLGKNGNALESLYAPLIIHSTPEHEELKSVAMQCVSRHYAYHYLGFANSQLKLFLKEQPRRVKALLYIYRVLLTGTHLLLTGQLESDMRTLYQTMGLSYIPELIARKQQGAEHAFLQETELAFHQEEIARLLKELEESLEKSVLPEHPDPRAEATLDDLLVRLRLRTV